MSYKLRVRGGENTDAAQLREMVQGESMNRLFAIVWGFVT